MYGGRHLAMTAQTCPAFVYSAYLAGFVTLPMRAMSSAASTKQDNGSDSD